MNLFKDVEDQEYKNRIIKEALSNQNNHDNFCQYHSAHDVRIHRVEDDVYRLTSTIDKFRNNILIMVINTMIQLCIVLVQFFLTAKDKLG